MATTKQPLSESRLFSPTVRCSVNLKKSNRSFLPLFHVRELGHRSATHSASTDADSAARGVGRREDALTHSTFARLGKHLDTHMTNSDECIHRHSVRPTSQHGADYFTDHSVGPTTQHAAHYFTDHSVGPTTQHGAHYFTDHSVGQTTQHGAHYFTDHSVGQTTQHAAHYFTDHSVGQTTQHAAHYFTDHSVGPSRLIISQKTV